MESITNILKTISIKADVFFSGNLCGIQSFDTPNSGHLHLLRTGSITLQQSNGSKLFINEPTVIFIPRPVGHRIISQHTDNTQLVCATVVIESISRNLLFEALPNLLYLPLNVERNIGRTTEWIFEEAFAQSVTRLVMLDKLCELFLLQLLRYVFENKIAKEGFVVAMTHPTISKVINAMHDHPEQRWTVDSLANLAAMSRSKFANDFKDIIGTTPNDYLTELRISLAQELLKNSKPVSVVANLVGYEHGSALARVFRQKFGLSPREWLKKTKHSTLY